MIKNERRNTEIRNNRMGIKLKDPSTINKVMKVKNVHPRKKRGTRKFGSGKTIFTYVADDFDATPEEFKDYMI